MNQKLKTLINKDLYRYGIKNVTPIQFIRLMLFDSIKRFVILWRIGN